MWKLAKLMFAAQPAAAIVMMLLSLIAGVSMSATIGAIGSTLGGAPDASFIALTITLSVAALSNFLARYMGARLAQRLRRNLQTEMAENIAAVPFSEVERLGAARLLAVLMDDTGRLASGMMSVPIALTSGLIVAGVTLHLAWVSGFGAGLWLIQLLLSAILFGIAGRIAGRHFKRSRAALDEVLVGFRGVTQGAKELRLGWRRREAFLSRFVRVPTLHAAKSNVQGEAIYDFTAMLCEFLFFGSIVLVLYLRAALDLDDTQLATYVVTILYVAGPLAAILFQMPHVQAALIAHEKIDELKTVRGAALAASSPLAETAPTVSVELLEVWYAYPRVGQGEPFEVGPIDIRMDPGTITFFVGGNGSGKSTLAKIVAGLYRPSDGEVRFNGQPLADEDYPYYREHITSVFADYFLFDRAWGYGDEVDESANELLRRLELPADVEMKGGKFTKTSLSSGQMRRLALVLSMLEDRQLFIFDEWAADQDVRYKEVFYRSLLPMLRRRGKTVVVVSHDDRYFNVADQLIKLDAGRQTTEQTVQFMVRLRGNAAEET